jgi:hypothetical protein
VRISSIMLWKDKTPLQSTKWCFYFSALGLIRQI